MPRATAPPPFVCCAASRQGFARALVEAKIGAGAAMNGFDTPGVTDNREYDYSLHPEQSRAEYPVIADWVPEGARVIDLGCGNGSLLALLKREKRVTELGLESAPSGVEQCRRKGLNVREGRIDVPLREIAADAFDVAICNVTLQMVQYPEVLMREMSRVAPVAIVSFPNFAFLRNRLDLLFRGRMPRPMLYGYGWYDTGHIHQLSVRDFRDLCRDVGWRIAEARYRAAGHPLLRGASALWPNLLASIPIVRLVRAGSA